MAAATRPGSRVGMSAEARLAPASMSMKLATSGPPKRAEIAENAPAVDSSVVSPCPRRASRAIAVPAAPPSAISGPRDRGPRRRGASPGRPARYPVCAAGVTAPG